MSCDSCIAASSRKSACSGHKGCQASFVVSCQVKRTSLHKHSLVKTASPILARRDRGLTLKSWPKNVPRKQKTRQNELPWPRRHQQCAAYLASLPNPTSDAQVMIQHIYEQSVHMHSRHCGISCCVLLSLPELQLAKHWNERMSSTHCHSDIKALSCRKPKIRQLYKKASIRSSCVLFVYYTFAGTTCFFHLD